MEVGYALEQFGLNKQEVAVYLSSLKLGVAKASQISQKAEIGRSGAYYILKLLKEKGLLSEVIKSGILYYSATSPERILQLIEEERALKKQTITSVLPELKSIQQTAIEKPIIEIYEGYEGFKTIFDKVLLNKNEKISCYLSPEVLDYLPHFHEQFRKRRAKNKIKIRTITKKTPQLIEISKLDKQELRETRFNDPILRGSEVLQYILEDAIIVIRANKKEQLAIYIQDKNLAMLHKNIFEQLWKQAKP